MRSYIRFISQSIIMLKYVFVFFFLLSIFPLHNSILFFKTNSHVALVIDTDFISFKLIHCQLFSKGNATLCVSNLYSVSCVVCRATQNEFVEKFFCWAIQLFLPLLSLVCRNLLSECSIVQFIHYVSMLHIYLRRLSKLLVVKSIVYMTNADSYGFSFSSQGNHKG